MKRQWKLMLLALVLIVTMVVMGQSTADASPQTVDSPVTVVHDWPPADHFNNLSALTCAASHPSPPAALSSWYIQYSNPYYYDANHIRYTCIGHYHIPGVGVVCVWTGIYWTGGTITGPYDTSCSYF